MVKSNYSISTEDGKNYSQEDIELILSSFENLVASTEAAREEIEEGGLKQLNSCMVADSDCIYGKRSLRKPSTRSTIKLDDAIRYLEENGTYEMAIFVSLMFHRILGDRMPERLKERLDMVVNKLSARRIVPVTINYYGEGSVGIGTIKTVDKLYTNRKI